MENNRVTELKTNFMLKAKDALKNFILFSDFVADSELVCNDQALAPTPEQKEEYFDAWGQLEIINAFILNDWKDTDDSNWLNQEFDKYKADIKIYVSELIDIMNNIIGKDDMPWIWIPNIRLNNLYFNKPYAEFNSFIADKYIINYYHQSNNITTYKSNSGGESFSFLGENHLFKKAIIRSNLYYQHQNIIGLSPAELTAVLMIDDLYFDTQQGNYFSKKLNATFCIENEIVESVILE